MLFNWKKKKQQGKQRKAHKGKDCFLLTTEPLFIEHILDTGIQQVLAEYYQYYIQRLEVSLQHLTPWTLGDPAH